ncbi:MAG: MopE-related protein [Pseudomonadota bacterium]|nr:MopE-related protein [Pseudomonadota bacterium]
MHLLAFVLPLAHAADPFTCDPIAAPADARRYFDSDPAIEVGDAAYDALYAWYDASCVTSCTDPDPSATSCDSASCVTGAGATLTWRNESIPSESLTETTKSITVVPPASAGLAWTSAEVVYTRLSGMDAYGGSSSLSTYTAEWTGSLDAAWPVDGAFTTSKDDYDGMSTYFPAVSSSWRFASGACEWRVEDETSYYGGYLSTEVTVGSEPVVLVATSWNSTWDHCSGSGSDPRGYLDEVLYAVVDADTWEIDGGPDADGDGWGAGRDCDDTDPTMNPCGGCPVDGDGDGAAGGSDCDDTDATVYVGAAEVAYDGVDQDCSGADLTDVDGDGEDADTVGGDDCDDDDATIGLGAIETECDGLDQDCDGADTCPPPGTDPEEDPEEEPDGPGCGGGAAALLPFVLLLAPLRRRVR